MLSARGDLLQSLVPGGRGLNHHEAFLWPGVPIFQARGTIGENPISVSDTGITCSPADVSGEVLRVVFGVGMQVALCSARLSRTRLAHARLSACLRG